MKKTAFRLCLYVISALFFFSWGVASAKADFAVVLQNKTGLSVSRYNVWVLGYSTTSKLMLDANGTFSAFPQTSGAIPSYQVGTAAGMLHQLTISSTVDLDSARVYFFVVPSGQSGPTVNYSNDGANVTQMENPPSPGLPPYSFVEITRLTTTPVIDIQTVDGFIFPLTITLNGNLGQIGQPDPAGIVTRDAILSSYTNFMTSLGAEGQPYRDLVFKNTPGSSEPDGILNPFYYLSATSAQTGLVNVASPLNSVYDTALDTLFSNTALSLDGVASGPYAADIYTVKSAGLETYPGTNVSLPALQFEGKNQKLVFNVFDPMGVAVLADPGTNQSITGTLNGKILTLDNPLPANTIGVGWYVSGAGTDPSTTRITAVTLQNSTITSLTLNNTSGNPAPGSQYLFSRLPDLFESSGMMVFGNSGLFADAKVQFPSDKDKAKILADLENQIVSALNRGVANMWVAPQPAVDGSTTRYWSTESNWYPVGQPQNLFSLFMHTGEVTSPSSMTAPIFDRPSSPVACARGTVMGMAYGFAYDEDYSAPGMAPQPQVPSKFDPTPDGTTTMTITLGPWQSGLWQDATADGNGWDRLDWFGDFYPEPATWIYHATLGWLYPVGTTTDSIWFWDPQWDGHGGWWWTSASVFPWVYSATENEWLYYDAKDSTLSTRWFFTTGGQASTH